VLEQILTHDETFSAPAWLKAQANLKDLEAEHARSIADPDAFWASWAERFEHCKTPRPSTAYADITTSCSRYRLMINCL